MRAGILNEIIIIHRPDVIQNVFGEQVDTYTPIARIRAAVSYKSGMRTDVNNEVFYAYSKSFIIRRGIHIDEFDRIEYKDKMYRILSINEDRQYNQITIECELINE